MTDKPNDSKSENTAPASRKTEDPSKHVNKIEGPLSSDAIHKTESKDHHPQGKTRHGGRDA